MAEEEEVEDLGHGLASITLTEPALPPPKEPLPVQPSPEWPDWLKPPDKQKDEP
jgi:hypothetical protein